MKIIKYLLIIILVLTCIGAGAYFVMLHLKPNQLPPQLQILQPVIQDGWTKASQSVSQLPQIGNVVSSAGNFIGDKLGTKDGDSNKENGQNGAGTNASLPQKTFEFARYTFCQQVVKDYEQRYSVASASATQNK